MKLPEVPQFCNVPSVIRDGRPSGEAYVEVESEDDVQKALERHKCNMGKRYIEVFESKHSDLEYACNKAAGSGFGGTDDPYGDDAVVKLRGLPYDAGKMQIADFFKGENTISNTSMSIFCFYPPNNNCLHSGIYFGYFS